MAYSLTDLFTYPVKSMRGNVSSSMLIDDFGPSGDRRYMLVDDSGQFVTQRKHPQMCHLSASIDERGICLSGGGVSELVYQNFDQPLSVRVWGDEVEAMSSAHVELDKRLSDYLSLSVRLVYMPDSTFRQVDRDYFEADQRVGFADAFPILLVNRASLADLNSRLESPVTVNRFRPNVVFDGDVAFQEDDWQRVKIGEVEFAVVKPCSRCVMTTVDEHGNKGAEPLRTLATYRKNSVGICFGQNLVPLYQGTISLDDSLTVLT